MGLVPRVLACVVAVARRPLLAFVSAAGVVVEPPVEEMVLAGDFFIKV